MVAVFDRMAPSVNNFGNALAQKGQINVKSNSFIGNVTKINKLYQSTASRMGYCAQLMADYFENFNANLQELF